MSFHWCFLLFQAWEICVIKWGKHSETQIPSQANGNKQAIAEFFLTSSVTGLLRRDDSPQK